MKCRFTFLSFYFLVSSISWTQTKSTFAEYANTYQSTLPLSATDLLVSYLKIPSSSGNEKMAGEFFRNVCFQNGLNITQFGSENGNYNFAASLYPLNMKKPNLIFINHIDVVPIGEVVRWMHPPLEGRVINDEIWGRGAFDNKGMAIIQLSAIVNFIEISRNENLPFNITLLSLSCEETQCPGGAKYIVENHLEELNPWAMIGEGPPALKGVIFSDPERFIHGIATGQKKALWLKLELTSKSSNHSSITPHEYSNQAMIKALNNLISRKPEIIFTPENRQILSNLGKMEGGIKGFALKNPKLFKPLIKKQLYKKPEVAALFTNSITITSISNQVIVQNAIPNKTNALLDCRLLPQTNVAEFILSLKKKLNNPNVTIETVFEAPDGGSSDKKHIVYKMLEHTIISYFGKDSKIVPIFLPNLTDSNWFRAKGIPVFDIAPFKIDRDLLDCIHGYDERIPISALKEGTEVFTIFISSLLKSILMDFNNTEQFYYAVNQNNKP